jgi:hypothetical protein
VRPDAPGVFAAVVAAAATLAVGLMPARFLAWITAAVAGG